MSVLTDILGVLVVLAAVFALVGVMFGLAMAMWEMWKDSRALSDFEKQLLKEAKLPRLPTQQIKAGEWRGGREE